MDVMDRRMIIGRVLASMAGGGNIPAFFNHLKSGSFSVSSGTGIAIPVEGISDPKGILIFSDTLFDLSGTKSEKPMLGAYAALYLKGSLPPEMWVNRQVINNTAFYFTNWGQTGNDAYPSARYSRTENRGLRYFNTQTSELEIYGFGTGDYDFKYNTTYNWIVWD